MLTARLNLKSEGDGYLSVDDFLYVRCAIVAEGETYFERVRQYPAELDSIFMKRCATLTSLGASLAVSPCTEMWAAATVFYRYDRVGCAAVRAGR